VSNAIGYANQYSRSHNAVIRVYDEAGNVIETHQHKGEFKECSYHLRGRSALEHSVGRGDLGRPTPVPPNIT
jgi:hypothetical protein